MHKELKHIDIIYSLTASSKSPKNEDVLINIRQ